MAFEEVETRTPSKSKTPKVTEVDLEAIQADVASFAAQLGLAPGDGFASGFDDSDFRKMGPVSGGEGRKKAVGDSKSERKKVLAGKKDRISPSAVIKKGEKAKSTGKLTGTGEDGGLSFGSGKSQDQSVVPEKGKGKKRALPSDTSGQKDEKIAKKERRGFSTEGDKKETDGNVKGALSTSGKKDLFLSGINSFFSKGHSSTLWYEAAETAAASLNLKTTQEANGAVASSIKYLEGDSLVASKRNEAERLMEKAVTEYEKSRSKNSDHRWLMTARRSGTSADKVAAMTVMLQDNPMLNLRTLDALLGMVTSKGGKRHAAVGIDALKELFLISLLPDRKLKYLNQQPLALLGDSKEATSALLFWYFEDCLKRRYERFIVALEEATKDSLLFLKEKALKTVSVLLESKPEQGGRLLSALVNKLGDPERKVASNASYLLSCLLTSHPDMKSIVVEEVDVFVFRPHVGTRARYYAAVFLNQIMLTNRGNGPLIAKKLINLYFSLFRTVTAGDMKEENVPLKGKKKNYEKWKKKAGGTSRKEGSHVGAVAEVDTRLLSALLVGVNRAFPYVAVDDVNSVIEEHTPVLFHLVHANNFNVTVQALMLLHQLLKKNQAVSERFYRALYAVLLSPSLINSSKAEMFLSLLFNALKEDINLKRIAAFAKRLTQVALQQPPNFACGCLVILSEVLKLKPSLWEAILQPQGQDEEIEHFVDIPDGDAAEEGLNWRPEGADSTTPDKNGDGASEEIGESNSDGESGEEENLRSIPDLKEDDNVSSDEGGGTDKTALVVSKGTKPVTISKRQTTQREASQPLTSTTVGNAVKDAAQKTWPAKGSYDPRQREPSYCNGDKACWWELTTLARHMHPSVAAMARTLLAGANVVYSGDPLRDLLLSAFLARFAEKKPKASKEKEDRISHAPNPKGASVRLVGEELLALDETEVAPDDVVFHKFYQAKVSKRTSKKNTKQRKGDEDDDITGLDGEDEDMMDGDDSDDDEVDALLDTDEGLAMGMSKVEGEDDVEEGDSEGEFDYNKPDDSFELEDENEDDESEEEELSAQKQKGKLVNSVANDFDELNVSDSDINLGEPPESESEDDSLGSIEVGDLPSDEESKAIKKKSESESVSPIIRGRATGAAGPKKMRRNQLDFEALLDRKKGKSKSPFASVEEYAYMIEGTTEERPTKGKAGRALGKKSRSSKN